MFDGEEYMVMHMVNGAVGIYIYTATVLVECAALCWCSPLHRCVYLSAEQQFSAHEVTAMRPLS